MKKFFLVMLLLVAGLSSTTLSATNTKSESCAILEDECGDFEVSYSSPNFVITGSYTGTIEIFDSAGNLVITTTKTATTLIVDVTALEPGVYEISGKCDPRHGGRHIKKPVTKPA